MKKLLVCVHKVQNWLLIIAVGYILAMVFAGVIVRYCFAKSIFGSDEKIGYVLVLIGMLGAVVNVRDDSNVYMDLLVTRVSRKVQPILYILVQILIAVALCVFVAAGWKLVLSSVGAKSTMNRIPMVLPYSIIPICLILMLLEHVINFIMRIRSHHLYWESPLEK